MSLDLPPWAPERLRPWSENDDQCGYAPDMKSTTNARSRRRCSWRLASIRRACLTRRGAQNSSRPETPSSRLPGRVRQRLHPRRGAGRASHDRRRLRDQRSRPARRGRIRRRRSTRSRTCRTTCSSTCSAAATATPTSLRDSPGRCSATRRRAGRGCRRSAITCTTDSPSATSTPTRRGPRSTRISEQRGVCRDFAHLAITLCRCMNIPARYCTGYLGDIGVRRCRARWISAPGSRSISAGSWHTFDARHNKPRIGRILMARGRDATDVRDHDHLRPVLAGRLQGDHRRGAIGRPRERSATVFPRDCGQVCGSWARNRR